jgi:hypothetical protein
LILGLSLCSNVPGFDYPMFSRARQTALKQAQSQLRLSRPLSARQQVLLSRLLSTLAVLEHKDGKLRSGSLSAVTAAQKLGGSITGFVAGSGVKAVAEEAAKIDGLEKVIMVENGSYDKVGYAGCNGRRTILITLSLGSPRKFCPSSC